MGAVLALAAGAVVVSTPAIAVQQGVTCAYDTPAYAYDVPAQLSSPDTVASYAWGSPSGPGVEPGVSPVSIARAGVAANAEAPLIKVGAEGGETAGKVFPQEVRQEVLSENPSTCVCCRMETETPRVDHVIPRVRGGNATVDNGQTTCPWCNASKGARDFPVNPPPGFEGAWLPAWWPSG